MRAWVLVSLLIAGAALSAVGMVLARTPGAKAALGLLCLTLWSIAGLLILFRLSLWLERRKVARRPSVSLSRADLPAVYTARYRLQDRIIAVCMAAFFAWLTAFFAYRATHIEGLLISACFCAFSVCYTIDLMVTRIVFTKERISARTWWHEETVEPYSHLRRAYFKLGSLTLRFSDGRSIKLHPGLGDSGIIVAYLGNYAPTRVVPTSEGE